MSRTKYTPRRSEGGVALAAAPAPARAPATRLENGPYGEAAGGSGETLVQKEEDTLGQLPDRLVPEGRVLAPELRAALVHINIVDSSSGEDTDGDGGGGKEEGITDGGGDGEGEVETEEEGEEEGEVEVKAAEEEEAEPRDQRAHAPGASGQDGSEAVRLRRLPPAPLSEHGSPRARLRAPGRVANNAIHDDSFQQQKEGGSRRCSCSHGARGQSSRCLLSLRRSLLEEGQ